MRIFFLLNVIFHQVWVMHVILPIVWNREYKNDDLSIENNTGRMFMQMRDHNLSCLLCMALVKPVSLV